MLKLREAKKLLSDTKDNELLKNSFDSLHGEVIDYINTPLDDSKKAIIILEVISALSALTITIGAIALIAASVLLSPFIAAISGIGVVSSIALFGIFELNRRNINDEIHRNTLIINQIN